MTVQIHYSFAATVEGGPAISAGGSVEVAAYGVIDQAVAAAGSETVDISPDAAGRMIVILSSRYEDVTYTVDGGVADVPLNGPQFLVGSGAVGLLKGGDPVETITFNNTGADDIDVTVLLGRDAS